VTLNRRTVFAAIKSPALVCLSLGSFALTALVSALLNPVASAAEKGSAAKAPARQQAVAEHPVDMLLASENTERGVALEAAPVVDDLTFLRRVSIDLIGRIPTQAEIDEYMALPQAKRRLATIDKMLADDRFGDKWTAFFADMLRLRNNSEGGPQLFNFVHKAVKSGMPYDEMCRRLIATNGKAGFTPEVGFLLGDAADPMALAGVTSQVFLGVRISCAQCHDHPFDVWKREDFYGFAAYFSRTKRVERRFKMQILSISALEDDKDAILWPPEGVGKKEDRKPMKARFPFAMVGADENPEYIARLRELRAQQQSLVAKANAKPVGAEVDDLLETASDTVKKTTSGKSVDAITADAKKDADKVKGAAGGYNTTELRQDLAKLITDPRNRFFSRSLVNRVWYDLIGHSFVVPVDDFSEKNQPSHPKTLEYLADEFVANGYDFRQLVRMIVSTNAYQRAHVPHAEEAVRQEMEANFLATPMRRMLSEVLFDSIVTGGHLFDVKHEAGKNMKTVWQESRVIKGPSARGGAVVDAGKLEGGAAGGAMMAKMTPEKAAPKAGYDFEAAIEATFEEALGGKDDDEAMVDKMAVKSSEEIEAERMAMERQRLTADYIDRFVKAIVDDNPKFSSSYRMPSPAPDGHFLRVFGQPEREQLGDVRDHLPSMRQALMLLNGRLTHEASRVGELEPLYSLVSGKKADLDTAVKLVYRELLTREPSADEIKDAREVIAASDSPLDGVADFRWVILNSNEFRFIP
jgi:hypothetical protein